VGSDALSSAVTRGVALLVAALFAAGCVVTPLGAGQGRPTVAGRDARRFRCSDADGPVKYVASGQ